MSCCTDVARGFGGVFGYLLVCLYARMLVCCLYMFRICVYVFVCVVCVLHKCDLKARIILKLRFLSNKI